MKRCAVNSPSSPKWAGLSRQIWADFALLLVALIWGSTFVMVKEAIAAYPVFPFLALRFSLATFGLLAIGGRRLRSLGWRGFGAGALIGLFLFGGYAFQTLGLRYASASKAGFITGLSVVLVPLLSSAILRQRPQPQAAVGVCLAVTGLALLSLNGALRFDRGDLFLLACALSFALHIVAVSAFAPKADPLALTIVQVATVALACGAVAGGSAFFTSAGWPLPNVDTWFAAAFTGILATAVAFGVQTAMQRFTTPTHTALIFAAEPVFAAVFGVLLAGDVLTARGLVGGLLIILGTITSELPWSERTAVIVSRFISPHYITPALLLALGVADPASPLRGLLWALALGTPVIAGTLLLWRRELRRGAISDWHVSRREERLQPIPILASLLATGLPLIVLYIWDGPRYLLAASLAGFALVLFNLLVTVRWKISQHVSSVALSTTLITAVLGIAAAPLLLLIPLVAWARVKVGAHTVLQVIAGGVTGAVITLGAVWLLHLW